ncbi:MAG TPA: copper-binding protein [Candidatus Pacebacteria bacterium]|nr:MAG: hypothetical protein UX00_C0017G0016 [Microgenomates group bacterium GW2011_GWB1_45_17]KKU23190.1 MAG: hypothetical protein UX35_C0009G0014 [Microgenomates group bacterium GW2011_GWA1_46_15]KKU24062.1 MAG: hypothetical protein UX36_C0002G0045 [Microgenomates group bacterium GW2011_GWC1_46_15]HAV14849.1 copper-binding protein [Candidatus Paceibacterota bacterium]HCR11240.1 copper-binding protein [Candidatus Paceibacterota bacterium]
MLTFFVNVFGAGLMIFTYWFFFMKKEEKAVEAESRLTITVDGGYTPNVIQLKRGQKTTLAFFRKDPSSCLEEVVMSEFKIRQFLPLNQTTDIVITPKETGTFDIHCGMNMYHGKIEVV